MTKALVKLIFISILLSTIGMQTIYAQEPSQNPEKYKGKVIEITQSGHSELGDNYQKLKVLLNTGEEIEVENNPQMSAKVITYKKGDNVILQKFALGTDQNETYIITDFNRLNYLTFVFILFVVLTLAIGKKYGFYSLLGMGFSFFIIFKFILPQIIAGRNPIFITVLASLFIIPITFYLSHGFNKKTHIAIASTVLTLIATTILTGISVSLAKLTGYSSDEAMFLQIANESVNMRGILLAGIIIGFLGVLDDVTVSQASIVTQLKKAKRNYSNSSLYKDAMAVGRDHITSMINTLILVYTGASMPLLLLFVHNPQPFSEVINMEIIADEIIRTLVGSIGLILAVPLSTFLATLVED